MITFRKKSKIALQLFGQELNEAQSNSSIIKPSKSINSFAKTAAAYNLQSTIGYLTRRVLNTSFKNILTSTALKAQSPALKYNNSTIASNISKSFLLENPSLTCRLNSTIENLKFKKKSISCKCSQSSASDRKAYSTYNSKEKQVAVVGNKQQVLKHILRKLQQKKNKDKEDNRFLLSQRVSKLEQTIKKMKKQHNTPIIKFFSKNGDFSKNCNRIIPTSFLDQQQESTHIMEAQNYKLLQKPNNKNIKQNIQVRNYEKHMAHDGDSSYIVYPIYSKQKYGGCRDINSQQKFRQQARSLLKDLRLNYSNSFNNTKHDQKFVGISKPSKNSTAFQTPKLNTVQQQFECMNSCNPHVYNYGWSYIKK